MSIKVMSRVWAQSSRKDGELLVLLALADFANDQGECWPSMPVLAHKARLTERQVRRVLDKLAEAGEIRRIRSTGGRNKRTRYSITLAENPDIITGKELQGKNNPVIGDRKTLVPVSGALNRHRTVNKRDSTESDKLIPDSSSTNSKRKLTRPDPALIQGFDAVWTEYPRRIAKEKARQAWIKLAPDPDLQQQIRAAIEAQRVSEEWQKDGGRYVPHLSTWLNGRRWEDEIPASNGKADPPKIARADEKFFYLEDGSFMPKDTYRRRYPGAKI